MQIGATYSAGEWYFVALTYDGTNHTLYTGTKSSPSAEPVFSTDIGSSLPDHYGAGNPQDLVLGGGLFGDCIDEVAVLSRAADADEIRAIFESNAPVFAESSTAFFKSYGRAPVEINEEGLWVEGPTVGAIFGIYGAASTKSWGGVTLSEGDVLLGRSPSYVLWDDSASLVTVNAKMLVRDESEFTGTMTIGTSGGIYQGTGTFASPTTGLKIWNDSGVGRIAGYNTGVAQWYANTNGKLYAGGGNAMLDSAGLSLEANPTHAVLPQGAVKWISSTWEAGATVAWAWAADDDAKVYAYLETVETAGKDSALRLISNAPTGETSEVVIAARVNGSGPSVTLNSNGITLAGHITNDSTLTLANTGLHILDTNASHDLIIAPGSDLTADRTLTVTTGDANRTLTLSGNATLNQDVSTTGSPRFDRVGVAVDPTDPSWRFEVSGNSRFTGNASITADLLVGAASSLARVTIDQSSTSGAVPVLHLDQADLSEEFIEFSTTVGAGNPLDTAALGSYYGKVRVNVTGVGYKYIPLYNS
jgi:hypothetical protein